MNLHGSKVESGKCGSVHPSQLCGPPWLVTGIATLQERYLSGRTKHHPVAEDEGMVVPGV
jgi:hypothetical protein